MSAKQRIGRPAATALRADNAGIEPTNVRVATDQGGREDHKEAEPCWQRQ
jgi:hypothetical protein